MRTRKTLTIILLAIACLSACTSKKETVKVNKILYNATFYTLTDSMPTAEAVVIDKGKIVALGKKDDLLKKYTADTMADLQGAFVYPGFIDGHGHFYGLGLFNSWANLMGSKSFDEVVGRLQEFAKTNTEPWLQGRGWDQNLWEGQQFPTKAKLDELFPDIPVLLKRVDGHAAIANQKALDLAGITPKTTVSGGKLLMENGKLTGVLVDNAVDLLEKAIPDPTNEQIRKYLLTAQDICFKNGLTSVVDPGLSKKYIDIIKQMQDEGALKIRLSIMVSADEEGLDYYIANGPIKTPLLNVSSFKLYGDGALGSRGACLLEPYSDDPQATGFLLQSPEKLAEIIHRVAKSNFQLCTHAIGDSTVRFVLDTYGAAIGENNSRRWRIEHVQIVNPNDIPKFKQFGVLPSMQPTHAMSDMEWALKRLGAQRLKTAYALKTFLQQNGVIILGTDFPVEGVSPLETFYTAVFRATTTAQDKEGFQPENALTQMETLKGMTIWAAYGSFEENEKGTIEPGKYADFTILDTDLLNTPSPSNAKITGTWVNGERVFKQNNP